MFLPRILPLLALSAVFGTAVARVGSNSSWTAGRSPLPKAHRSLQDLSTDVFEELRSMHEEGPFGSIRLPRVAHKVHRILVEGSANEGEEFDHHARGRALEALHAGAASLSEHVMDHHMKQSRLLEEHEEQLILAALGNSNSQDSHDELFPTSRNNPNMTMVADYQLLHRQLKAKTLGNIAGFILFSALLIFLTVLFITNIIIAENDFVTWDFLGNDNAYFTGTPQSSFKRIQPCNKLPFAPDETGHLFSYLPITQGIIGNLLGSLTGTGDFADPSKFTDTMATMFAPDEWPEDVLPNPDNCLPEFSACNYTAECCRPGGENVVICNDDDRCEVLTNAEVAGGGYSFEPFCLAWSKTAPDAKSIDTFAFAPALPWPPIQPLPLVLNLLPFCPIPLDEFSDLPDGLKVLSCKLCQFTYGFPIADIVLAKVKHKLTVQWDGVAMSWAKGGLGKIAYGTNDATGGVNAPEIWDGFRNIPLPTVSGLNFWIRLRFNLVESLSWEQLVYECTSKGFYYAVTEVFIPKSLMTFSYFMDIELYVGGGVVGTTDEEAEAAGGGLAEDLTGGEGSERRRLGETLAPEMEGMKAWRKLQATSTSEDPCVILAMPKAGIKLPLLAGDLVFADAVGGFCNFSPEETGVRCTPSGFFFNIKNQFRVEGLWGGALASFLESGADELGLPLPPLEKGGNSIGFFKDPDGRIEAVVFRLEMPVTSLFGVPLTGGVSFGRPVVHFQFVKGSEVERRRSTLLRKRLKGSNDIWIANCVDVRESCPLDGWSPFETDTDTDYEFEICSDILLNPDQDPDKLLYYNRILTADPVDDFYKYKISHPPGLTYRAPAKYNFRNNLDGDILIFYFAILDLGNIIIEINEISVAFVVSDGPPPIRLQDVADEFAQAQAAYDALSEANKAIFREPDLFHFPSLAQYKEYLPSTVDEIPDEAKMNATFAYNTIADDNNSRLKGIFIRLYCQISVLFFISIKVGAIMENYADGVSPTVYAFAAQFEIELIGFTYKVGTSTKIDFDLRRHRHLEGEALGRALAADGLEEADFDVVMEMLCSTCEAIEEFFENVGEAIWDGMQSIGKFFAEDVNDAINKAVDAVEDWGKKFIGSIVDFREGIENDIRDVFENGEVAKLLNSERRKAFDEQAEKTMSLLSDDKFTISEAVAIGKLALDGVVLQVELIVAGITDLVNAMGAFFNNVVDAIGDLFNISNKSWTETRSKDEAFSDGEQYTNPSSDCFSACETARATGDINKVKKNCWCMDEYDCPVILAQRRFCKEVCFIVDCIKECSDWGDVEIEKDGKYPRFDTRKFDKSCRVERMARLAEAEDYHADGVQAAQTVDTNVQENFKGLNNFSPASRRRRRLNGDSVTTVQSFSVPSFQAVTAGSFGDTTFGAMYEGAELKAESTGVNTVTRGFDRTVNFADYKRGPGQTPSDRTDIMSREAQLGSTDEYLGALKMDDPVWLAKQPIIEAPKLSISAGSPGTSTSNPVEFGCEGALAAAWMDKLQGSEPEAMRRRRRRLQSGRMEETLIEIAGKAMLRQTINTPGGVQLAIQLGNVVGENGQDDIFMKAKELIGTDGVGSFMNPGNRRFLRELQGVSLDDYRLDITVTRAEPLCDRYEWSFEVAARDAAGKASEAVTVHAMLLYGDAELDATSVENIQTVCDSDPHGVKDLEDNQVLKFMMGVDQLSPKLRDDNCRNPFLHLASSDVVLTEGIPCTTVYKTIQRKWSLLTHDSSCPVPDGIADAFPDQMITVGGFVNPNTGLPATPTFELQNQVYILPNEPEATISTHVTDYYRTGNEPMSQCGICDVEGIPGIYFSHTQPWECSEVGENTVSVMVLNRIGIKVTKTAIAKVIDDKPPNMFTKDHTVFLNEFGWLNEEDIVTVPDVDGGSWDNCGIELEVGPTPVYQCNDEGPQTVTLSAVDPSGNTNSMTQTIMVDDSARLGIDNDNEIMLPVMTDNMIDTKMRNDFNFKKCEEIAVYMRLEGETNFKSFEEFSNGVNGKWSIPMKYQPSQEDSVLFYEAFCEGVSVEDQLAGQHCVGEVKAEVLCEDRNAKGADKNVLHQTCYRARLNYDTDASSSVTGGSGLPGYTGPPVNG